VGIYFRNSSHHINLVIGFLYSSIRSVSDEIELTTCNEVKFKQKCEEKLRRLLRAVSTIHSFRIFGKKRSVWAAIYLYNEENNKLELLVHNEYSHKSAFLDAYSPNVNKELDAEKFFGAYAYNHTPDKKAETKSLVVFQDFLLRNGHFENKDYSSCLDVESAIGKCLRYGQRRTGLLLLGSQQKGTFNESDVRALSVITPKITSVLAHFEENCIWHKRGWRAISKKQGKNMADVEFKFILDDYFKPDFLSKVLNNVENKQKYKNRYDGLLNALQNDKKVSAVILSGSFNGWNTHHIFMEKESGKNVWRYYLRLPSGYYQYKYFLEFSDQFVDRETNNWILSPNKHAIEINIFGEIDLVSQKTVL